MNGLVLFTDGALPRLIEAPGGGGDKLIHVFPRQQRCAHARQGRPRVVG